MSKAKLKNAEKVEIVQPEMLLEPEKPKKKIRDIAEEVIKEKKEIKPKGKKEMSQEESAKLRSNIMKSSIINRVSPSTIATIFCAYTNKDEIMKAIIAQFAPTLTAIDAKEFKQITTELNKLID